MTRVDVDQAAALAVLIKAAKEAARLDYVPHCEFLAAPLGNKNCHYERSISTVRYATSTKGLPILSVDDGKTWTTFTPDAGVTVPSSSTVERVFITWEKKED